MAHSRTLAGKCVLIIIRPTGPQAHTRIAHHTSHRNPNRAQRVGSSLILTPGTPDSILQEANGVGFFCKYIAAFPGRGGRIELPLFHSMGTPPPVLQEDPDQAHPDSPASLVLSHIPKPPAREVWVSNNGANLESGESGLLFLLPSLQTTASSENIKFPSMLWD